MQFPDLLLIVESGHTTLALPFQTQLFPAVTVAAENLSSWELTDRGSGGNDGVSCLVSALCARRL